MNETLCIGCTFVYQRTSKIPSTFLAYVYSLTIVNFNVLLFFWFSPHSCLVNLCSFPGRILLLIKEILSVLALQDCIHLRKEAHRSTLVLADLVVIFKVLVFGATLSPVSHHSMLEFQTAGHLLEDCLVSMGALQPHLHFSVSPDVEESPNLFIRPVSPSLHTRERNKMLVSAA